MEINFTSKEESKRTPWWKQKRTGGYDEEGDGYGDEETRITNNIYCTIYKTYQDYGKKNT